jgi:hypothetical protein
MTPTQGLEREIEAYEKRRAELEANSFGKWVVFRDQQLIGTFDTLDAAASEATTRFGRGPYLIREVGAPPIVPPASFSQRAARRDHWPVRVTRLADASQDDLSAYTTAVERVLMVAQLTAEAWALTGMLAPMYKRSQTPVALRSLRSPSTMQG